MAAKGARINDMKHRAHLYWKVLSRAHCREGKNRRPHGKGIFIISTARRHRPLRKAGECLKYNAIRFRPHLKLPESCKDTGWRLFAEVTFKRRDQVDATYEGPDEILAIVPAIALPLRVVCELVS
jgi:hypothetical protein